MDVKDSFSGQLVARLKQARLGDEHFRFAIEFGSPLVTIDFLRSSTLILLICIVISSIIIMTPRHNHLARG